MKTLIKQTTDDTPELAWLPGSLKAVQGTSTVNKPITPIQAIRPLTRKQQAFVQHIVKNPKASATAAAQAAYNVTNKTTAASIASENLIKPNILTELAKHSATSEFTLLEVMEYSKNYGRDNSKQGASYASVAAGIANSVLDRLHGKATIKQETVSTSLVLNIDLTGVTGENK